MSDAPKQQIPEIVVDLMVDSIFRKNGIKPDELKKNLTDEQKHMLKEMVEDLKDQVDQFKKRNANQNEE